MFAEQHTAGPTIGVIGLGTIGGGIATNVHAAGLPLVVYDVRVEATDRHRDYATVTTSPTDLVHQSDIVVVAVVNDEQVRAVLSGPEGALAAGAPGTTVVVVSTITTASRPGSTSQDEPSPPSQPKAPAYGPSTTTA